MTKDKARKRDVRARMTATGERYAAAQRNVRPTKLTTADLGVADAAVRRGSGKGWDEWIRLLDRWGARHHTHSEIARHVHERFGVDGWWAQSVTVGYERARGMRAPHERPDGFALNASKTVKVDVEQLARAWTDTRQRNRWLPRGTLRMRTSQEAKSARFDLLADGTRVHLNFWPKGEGKSSVSLEHRRLPDAQAVASMRTYWRAHLARMAELLER